MEISDVKIGSEYTCQQSEHAKPFKVKVIAKPRFVDKFPYAEPGSLVLVSYQDGRRRSRRHLRPEQLQQLDTRALSHG